MPDIKAWLCQVVVHKTNELFLKMVLAFNFFKNIFQYHLLIIFNNFRMERGVQVDAPADKAKTYFVCIGNTCFLKCLVCCHLQSRLE